ncbi:MAG: dienelactone hydrolase family protein [Gammaproteobacteria bacterium]|nr:dienelactone hydrolase family protein [Gammaproteobacteria bacterium]
MSFRKHLVLIFIAVILSFNAHAGIIERNLPSISYVQYQSFDPLNPGTPLTISGQLRVPVVANELPDIEKKIPAVIILHGSAGVDSRGALYIQALNDAGIATFEIDMWAARGLPGGFNRPSLPTINVPDAFGALKYLSELPDIDVERIGIMGFSWGGVVTMLAATEDYNELYGEQDLAFAAHVAHYPVCWAYNVGVPGMNFNNITGAPLLIQIGELDDYDEGSAPCENLIASLPEFEQPVVSLNVYPRATHAWDRLQPAITVYDPFSHLGDGGYVDMVPKPGKAFQSRRKAVRFFQELFGLDHKNNPRNPKGSRKN